ncbi:hypothetical protein MRX96_039737 [Rhipicephalus microplus]
MSASTDQLNAQEQSSQRLLPTPVSKQPLPHDCIATNLDTLLEDEDKYTTPTQQPLLIKKPSQALKSVTLYRPHLRTTQVEAYNSSADGVKDDSGYDSDALTKDETNDEDTFRAQTENHTASRGDFPHDGVVQVVGGGEGSSKGSREALRVAEVNRAGSAIPSVSA